MRRRRGEKEKALIISNHNCENAIIMFNNSINFAIGKTSTPSRDMAG